jgi:hypothetical protein
MEEFVTGLTRLNILNEVACPCPVLPKVAEAIILDSLNKNTELSNGINI